MSAEEVFFELALEDIARATDLFRPIYDRISTIEGVGVAGSVTATGPPCASTVAASNALYAGVGRPNVFIKIPGTTERLLAVEEALFAGVLVAALRQAEAGKVETN